MLLNRRNLEIIRIAGEDNPRYALGSLYIDVDTKKTVVTDGHRLASVTFPEGVKDEEFPQVNGLTASPMTKNCLVPKEGVDKLLKVFPKTTALPILSHVAIDGAKTDADEQYAHMGITDLESPQVFTIRKKEGPFPDYRQVFPKGAAIAKISVNAKYLIEILQLVKGYEDRNSKVEIEIRGSDQPLVIRAQDRDTDQVFEALLMPMRCLKSTPIPAETEEITTLETADQEVIEDNPTDDHSN